MAIDLLNRLAQTQANTEVTKKAADAVKNADSVLAARILKTVLSLHPGDTLRGELVSANGKDISLLLEDTVLLNAKMDKELMLTLGQKMSFSVDSNQNGKLSLKPLFANTGMEQNAMKALEAANIPVTDRTLALAEEMMHQGMSVSKQNLGTLHRQMGMYPDAPIEDLVMLHKMNIPVTEENLSMMRLYQTGQQYLFSDMEGLCARTADFLMELQQQQPEDLQNFIRGFVDIFKESVTNPQENAPVLEETSQNDRASAGLEGSEHLAKQEPVTENARIVVTENGMEGTESTVPDADTAEEPKEAEWLRLVKEAGTKTEGAKENLVQNLFDLLREQFLMKPEQMNSAEYVKEFYEHLTEQVDKLQKLIKNAGKEESAFGKEVSSVKSNIQFMNQINEIYHYVQLPIKMNNEGANGDLYVYKRKKAATGDDGKLTALLHLSMPVLGNMDIFLSLEEEKLSTRFCMEKEEMIDFIEQHIDQLNERLIKRGYHVMTTVTASTKEEEKSVIAEVMKTEKAIPIMTSQSFDALC